MKKLFTFTVVLFLILPNYFAFPEDGNEYVDELYPDLPEERGSSTIGDDARKEIIISTINAKSYQFAANFFAHFGSNDKAKNILSEIVTSVYNKSVDNVEKILLFLGLLPGYCALDQAGYKSLYTTMSSNKQLKNPENYLVAVYYRKHCGEQETYEKIGKLMNINVNYTILTWAQNIRRKEYNSITSFITKYGNEEHFPLELMLKEIIPVAYANSTINTNSILAFLHSFNRTKVNDGLVDLYEAMVNSGDPDVDQKILKFSFQLKEAIDLQQDSQNNKLTALKNKLPLIIQKMVWGNLCSIKNVHYGEYLYESNKNDNGDNTVFTSKSRLVVSLQKYWRFEHHNYDTCWIGYATGSGIKSKVTYLKETEKNYDTFRKSIFTGNNGKEVNWDHLWALIPINITGIGNSVGNNAEAKGIFYLRRGFHYQYLYAGNNTVDNNKRRVFILMGTRTMPRGAEWEISC